MLTLSYLSDISVLMLLNTSYTLVYGGFWLDLKLIMMPQNGIVKVNSPKDVF